MSIARCLSCRTSSSTSKRCDQRIVGQRLERVRILSPFLLRTAAPPISAAEGKQVDRSAAHRQAHRHRSGGRPVPGAAPDDRRAPALARAEGQAARAHHAGAVRLRQRHARVHRGRDQAARVAAPGAGRGGAARSSTRAASRCWTPTSPPSRSACKTENHTLKRALTDPHIFSGIGNAYSDEILHRAKLSPVALSAKLDDEEVAAPVRGDASGACWSGPQRLRAEARRKFPEKVTAFREGMAVHGRFGQPCPVCGAPVQRIVYAENETNYCARCQTGGKLLADRALSRLLQKSWPRNHRRAGVVLQT